MSSGQQQVKLRLIWKAESLQQQAGPTQCFNETLTEVSFSAWRERVSNKFKSSGALSLRYCLHDAADVATLPLESEQDFQELKLQYKSALEQHKKPSTFRIIVLASTAASSSAAPSGVQTRRQRALQCSNVPEVEQEKVTAVETACALQLSPVTRPGAEEAEEQSELQSCAPDARPVALKSSRDNSLCGTPVSSKKLRVQKSHSETTTCITPSEAASLANAQSDVCWDHILRSIVKTVDRHHFGSKLGAARAAS